MQGNLCYALLKSSKFLARRREAAPSESCTLKNTKTLKTKVLKPLHDSSGYARASEGACRQRGSILSTSAAQVPRARDRRPAPAARHGPRGALRAPARVGGGGPAEEIPKLP